MSETKKPQEPSAVGSNLSAGLGPDAVRELDDLLCNLSQLLDSHAGGPHEFSEWDHQQRKAITEYRMKHETYKIGRA